MSASSTAGSMLIRGASAVMTGLRGSEARAGAADIRIRGGLIEAVGKLAPLPGEEVVDASGCVVYPGWVNTHHHLFQTVMKGTPESMNVGLREWLVQVPGRYRKQIDETAFRASARLGMVELMLSGCSTIADHNYLYYPGMPFDSSAILFEEAERFGIRFVLCRGAMTKPQPGYEVDPPAYIKPETVDGIVADVERLVKRFHDAGPLSMRRVVMAPTTPAHRVRPEELVELSRAARRMGLRLHSHLSENVDYVTYYRERHDCLPLEFCEQHEWVGPDVWFAHLCHVTASEIALMARTGTGIAHCPGSNCRIGSGIAPAPAMQAAGMPVSLGVDGSASNEPGDMLSEVHLAWYLHRAALGATGADDGGADAISVEDAIHWGTAGGAKVLGLQTGVIAPGQAADLAIYSMKDPRCFGMHDDSVAPVALGPVVGLEHLICAGRRVVDRGVIPGLDLAALRADARAAVEHLRKAS